MATIEFKGIDKYAKVIQEMANPRQVEKMCKYSIYDAAGYLLEEIKKATPVGHDRYMMPTGDLADSLITTPMQDKDGFIYEKIDFAGYDRKGVPNRLKARALESGTSKMKKRPFVRPTVKRCKAHCEGMMETSMDKYLSHFMKAKEI